MRKRYRNPNNRIKICYKCLSTLNVVESQDGEVTQVICPKCGIKWQRVDLYSEAMVGGND